MGELPVEKITSEYIRSFESDLESLKSKEPELTGLVNELRTVERQIEKLNRELDEIDQIKPPTPTGILSIEEKPIWGNFVGELKEYIHKKETRVELEKELKALATKKKEMSGKIIKIVPARIRIYQPQIKGKEFIIDVSDDHVTLIA